METKPDIMTVILTRELARANREIEELQAQVRKLKGEDKRRRVTF